MGLSGTIVTPSPFSNWNPPHVVRHKGRDAFEIVGAHARGEERLVRVTERRVRHQQVRTLADGLRKRLGAGFLWRIGQMVSVG